MVRKLACVAAIFLVAGAGLWVLGLRQMHGLVVIGIGLFTIGVVLCLAVSSAAALRFAARLQAGAPKKDD